MARTKQDKFSFPVTLGKRFRDWCKAHHYETYTDGLTQLLDLADMRDLIERTKNVMERNIETLEAIEQHGKPVIQTHALEQPQAQITPDTVPQVPMPTTHAHGRCFDFGKYRGRAVLDIVHTDIDYIDYLLCHASDYSHPFVLSPAEQQEYQSVKDAM